MIVGHDGGNGQRRTHMRIDTGSGWDGGVMQGNGQIARVRVTIWPLIR